MRLLDSVQHTARVTGLAVLILLAGCRDSTGVEVISHEYTLELQADREIETVWETQTTGRYRDGSLVTATALSAGTLSTTPIRESLTSYLRGCAFNPDDLPAAIGARLMFVYVPEGSVTATLFEDGRPVASATGTGPGYLTDLKVGATLNKSGGEASAADNLGAVSPGCEMVPPPGL